MENDKEMFDHWLSLQPKKITVNSEVVVNQNPKELLLHMSTASDIKKFTPRMPENVAANDNTLVPRLCVSKDLAGCIRGHGRMHWDIYCGDSEYTIYGFEWERVLMPNQNIAGIGVDAVGSEYWMVGYKEKYVYIDPVKVGRVRFTALTTVPGVKKEQPEFWLSGVIELNRDVAFFADGKDSVQLEAGTRYQFGFEPFIQKYPKHDERNFSLKAISHEDYNEAVNLRREKSPSKLKSLAWVKK